MLVTALRCGRAVEVVPVSSRMRVGGSMITGTVRGTGRAGYKILWTVARYALGSGGRAATAEPAEGPSR
jgi:hypothetical protein